MVFSSEENDKYFIPPTVIELLTITYAVWLASWVASLSFLLPILLCNFQIPIRVISIHVWMEGHVTTFLVWHELNVWSLLASMTSGSVNAHPVILVFIANIKVCTICNVILLACCHIIPLADFGLYVKMKTLKKDEFFILITYLMMHWNR